MDQKVSPEIIALAQDIKKINDNIRLLVEHVNEWVARIQGIDTVAFAALALHEGKAFELTDENVTKFKEEIQKVVDTMERYKEAKREEAKKEAKKAEKSKSKLLVPGKKNAGKIITQ